MYKMFKKMCQYPRLTVEYPRVPFDPKFITGKPEINSSSCTWCGECVQRCPAGAIVLDKTEQKIGINLDECIFCSLCEEVCPAGAIVMAKEFELAERSRNSLRQGDLKSENRDIHHDFYEAIGGMLKDRVGKLFGRSLQIREVDAGSCNGCDYEINALSNPFNDLERFGVHFVASPRHADMLLVTGTVSRNMELGLVKTYNATPDPKLVVAVGACACSGGIFRESYAVRKGIDSVLPVDGYIPGCPPRPQAIIYGILKVLNKIK
jgi:Ni,Fe-hydrogenase III small subunit/formate hydrogenlyase subunit 6/NADH:ubiquinone oxidoreductase subunit I